MTYQWQTIQTETPIVELRHYRLVPGRRDELIALFEKKFIEPQEAVGARVLGSFTLADDPDSFVWLRGFADMPARRTALEGFYDGPVWRANRAAANATMIASDNVHLLRAITPAGGLPLGFRRPALGEVRHAGRFALLVSELRYPEWIGSYHLWLRLFLRKAGIRPEASFATLPAENNFPALPVRKNRSVHVALIRTEAALPELPPELANMLRLPPEVLALTPTARSLLR